MNTRNILYILGTLILFLGIAMLFPLLCSLYYKEGDSSSFAYSLLITFCIGALFYFLFRPVNGKISLTHKEGFLIVATGWFLAAVFGSLPYMIYGALPQFGNAFFESMSGFTTTGATVITNIGDLPHGILLWRSLTQWLGGMGDHYTVHCHTPPSRSRGDAAIQGGTAQSRERQTYSPCGGDGTYTVDSLYHHLHS